MKKALTLVLIMIVLTGTAFADDLYTAFGFDFGTYLDEIEVNMRSFERTSVKREDNIITATLPKIAGTEAFGRTINSIVFHGENNRLVKTEVKLYASDSMITKDRYSEAEYFEMYDLAVDMWANVITEVSAAYGESNDAAVYCGRDVSMAILTDTSTIKTSDGIKTMMPVEWYARDKHCGIVIHFNNVMLEFALTDKEMRFIADKPAADFSLYDTITITYSNEPYGRLVAIEPTPSPEPKQSLDGLNIMG